MIKELDFEACETVAGGINWRPYEDTASINLENCSNRPYPCTRSMVRGGEEYPVDNNGDFVFD